MKNPALTEANTTARARQLELIRAMTAGERLVRALELSAFTLELAWQGARLHSGRLGPAAVRDRFLQQVYGPAFAAWAAARRPPSAGE